MNTARFTILSLATTLMCSLAASCSSSDEPAPERQKYALEIGNISFENYTETAWNGRPASRVKENDDLTASELEWNGTEHFYVRELSDDNLDFIDINVANIGHFMLTKDEQGQKAIDIINDIYVYRDVPVNKLVAFSYPANIDISDQSDGIKHLLISDTAYVAKGQTHVNFNFKNGLGILRVFFTGPYADEVQSVEFDSSTTAGIRIIDRGLVVRPFGGYGYIKTQKHITGSGTFWQAAVIPDNITSVSGSGKYVHISSVEYIRINGDKVYSLIEALRSGLNTDYIIAPGKITTLTVTCNNHP